MTSKAEADLIDAALVLDSAEAVWDNPAYSFHHAVCESYENAKREFRVAVAEYRRAYGEFVATEVGQR